MHRSHFIVGVSMVVLVGVVGSLLWVQIHNRYAIDSFKDCVSAGYYAQKSYPEACQTPDGRSFEPASRPAITKNEAQDLITNCQAKGTYSFDSGEAGLILKDGTLQPVKESTRAMLRGSQNAACPLAEEAIE